MDYRNKSNNELLQEIAGAYKGNITLSDIATKSDSQLRDMGLKPAQIKKLKAALELSKRRMAETNQRKVVKSSQDGYWIVQPYLQDLQHEEFWVIFLNRGNMVIDCVRISSGGMHGTVVDPKLLLRKALESGASAMILAHNHPSGNLTPSQEDKNITQKIASGALYLDIKVLDHIIVGGTTYLSLADEGLLSF